MRRRRRTVAQRRRKRSWAWRRARRESCKLALASTLLRASTRRAITTLFALATMMLRRIKKKLTTTRRSPTLFVDPDRHRTQSSYFRTILLWSNCFILRERLRDGSHRIDDESMWNWWWNALGQLKW